MSTRLSQVFVCGVCGNMVEVIRAGAGTLVCCGVPMDALEENSTDAAQEKHVPVIEPVDGGVKVQVGSVPHPMGADHLIEWIEVIAGGMKKRQHLGPDDPPEAVFPVPPEGIVARESCNLHGLWKAG